MYLQKINLKNKYALVTGAGKGLGRACTIALAEAGATVIALSRTSSDLDKLEKEIKKIKGRIIKVHCDVMNYEDLQFLPPHLSNTDGGHTMSGGSSPPNFFVDKYFHQLVLRTMIKEGYNWNTVKRNLRRHTLDGEEISISQLYEILSKIEQNQINILEVKSE